MSRKFIDKKIGSNQRLEPTQSLGKTDEIKRRFVILFRPDDLVIRIKNILVNKINKKNYNFHFFDELRLKMC